ncbi:MAG: glycoside hydrolase 100 family protein [Candidatus Tantalella remota]|nr:glycoside hydrolase 100 family protein [Candidatus Tantalella remota]
MPKNTFEDAYSESISLLKSLVASDEYNSIGFFASSLAKDNYKRLFTRDAFWVGQAALLSGDADLLDAYDNSLSTLRAHQRKDGAIPSNVSCDGQASYGIINPRVDPTTLYILACTQRYKISKDKSIIDGYLDSLEKALRYLSDTWENRNLKILYIPRAGNWADEYLQRGYVLYDEVLWYLALREYADILDAAGIRGSERLREKSEHVKEVIRTKFWIKNLNKRNDEIYRKLLKKFDFNKNGYFIHFFYAKGKTRKTLSKARGIFDAFGNVLTLLAGVAAPEQSENIVSFINEISVNKYPLIPAHYPFFGEEVFKSQKLHQYRFKEYVGHYHNGGLWPWYTGLYVAFLSGAGRREEALRFLGGIRKANKARKKGMNFCEYHVSKRATSRLIVRRKEGVDLYLSMRLSRIIGKRRSTVKMHYGTRNINAENSIVIRSLLVPENEELRLSVIGPDAEDVLYEICGIGDNAGKCFECRGITVTGMEPGGTPHLGVSAAAYIIGHKAYFDNKVLFQTL